MFDNLLESTSQRRNTRTWLCFTGSVLIWTVVLIGVAVAGIMLADASLDTSTIQLSALVTPPAPAPPRGGHSTVSKTPTHRFEAPVRVPTGIARQSRPTLPAPAPGTGTGTPVVLGTPDGEDGGNGTDLTATLSGPPGVTLGPVPPPPVEPPLDVTAATPPGPRRVSSTVLSGKAIHRVEPRYPPIAVQLGVKGTVIVEVLVDEQGRVISTRVISGPLVLRDCSVRAAERWRFTPTTLNETPVKVIGTIAFNFRHG